MKENNQFGFEISISINGESGLQIKNKIASRLGDRRNPNQYSIPLFFEEHYDFAINDPLYIYIDEFIKFYIKLYPEVLWYSEDVEFKYYNEKIIKRRPINVWVSNFRQRAGSLEITFELVVETVMFYGGIRPIIDYLVKDLEIRLSNLAGNAVGIAVKDKYTKIRLKGKKGKFRISNKLLKLLMTIGLFALSFVVILKLNYNKQTIERETVKSIVEETINELNSEKQKVPKDSTNVKTKLKKE